MHILDELTGALECEKFLGAKYFIALLLLTIFFGTRLVIAIGDKTTESAYAFFSGIMLCFMGALMWLISASAKEKDFLPRIFAPTLMFGVGALVIAIALFQR